MNPLFLTDFYKFGHKFQYPDGTEFVYSNFTPRKSRMPGVDRMAFFGLRYLCLEYLIKRFNRDFFSRDESDVVLEYQKMADEALGGIQSVEHIRALHKLGYLPIEIKALPEGSLVPMRVPVMTIVNTHPSFAWVTNYLETLISCVLWQPCTSATIACAYRAKLDSFAKASGMDPGFVQWQGHDFSCRGMSSAESSIVSGMAHLMSFTGTDSVAAVAAMDEYYTVQTGELVGGSVPATEHSVMCAGGKDDEIGTFRRLITEVYTRGIVSIVSDSWDLWRVLTEYAPTLKSEIMARDGRVVFRPDSGDPVDILCGDPKAQVGSPASLGVIELLWNVFCGTATSNGFRVLDTHVGAIYGDSITLDRADQIARRLMAKGFAPQVVLGIGSFTYQHNTRDTFGTAIKATWVQINGRGMPIFKDPKTDDGTKKSACGLLSVVRRHGEYELVEGTDDAEGNLLSTAFKDGKLYANGSMSEIRTRMAGERKRYWNAT